MELLGDLGRVESCFGVCGDSVSVVEGRCTVCTKRTTGLEIILDTHDGTPW
jgi:hypothetical protein